MHKLHKMRITHYSALFHFHLPMIETFGASRSFESRCWWISGSLNHPSTLSTCKHRTIRSTRRRGGGGEEARGSSDMRPPLQAHVAAVFRLNNAQGDLTTSSDCDHESSWCNVNIKASWSAESEEERKDAGFWVTCWLLASCDASGRSTYVSINET